MKHVVKPIVPDQKNQKILIPYLELVLPDHRAS